MARRSSSESLGEGTRGGKTRGEEEGEEEEEVEVEEVEVAVVGAVAVAAAAVETFSPPFPVLNSSHGRSPPIALTTLTPEAIPSS